MLVVVVALIFVSRVGMQMQTSDVNGLSVALQKMVSNPKEGEKMLKAFESEPFFLNNLLHIIGTSSTPDAVITKQAASICLKNFVKGNWERLEEESASNASLLETRETLKRTIVSLLLQTPERAVQSQLIEVVVLIASHEFPASWPNLIQEVLEKMNLREPAAANVCFRILHGVFKRYFILNAKC